MRVGQISTYTNITPSFGITTKKPHREYYSANCCNEISEGKFKDYSFVVYNNHEHGRLNTTLVILRKLGHWIKSRIRYTDRDGNRQLIWYYK